MMTNLPNYLAIIMGLITILTVILFHCSLRKSSLKNKAIYVSLGIFVWMLIQAALSYNLFYANSIQDIPPKFPLSFAPTIFLMITLFLSNKGRSFIDSLPLKDLTWISIVRIPVEFTLWGLFLFHAIPEVMTFEGLNYDILAGITAPFIAYFGYTKAKLSKKVLLVWNVIGLILLLNIILISVLAFPSVFQKIALDQPNLAMLYFPFIWLPAVIVPIVLFTHFVSIRKLIKDF